MAPCGASAVTLLRPAPCKPPSQTTGRNADEVPTTGAVSRPVTAAGGDPAWRMRDLGLLREDEHARLESLPKLPAPAAKALMRSAARRKGCVGKRRAKSGNLRCNADPAWPMLSRA